MTGLLAQIPKPESLLKFGWPWTSETEPKQYANLLMWPKISVLIPSFNQGEYLEETLRSVLLQNYPSIQIIVIDGGSTDQSVGILNKYDIFINFWVSEPDSGQSDALNKAFLKADGEIICWLNSDDTFLPECLISVAKMFQKGSKFIIGEVVLTAHDGRILNILNKRKSFSHLGLLKFWMDAYIPAQPGVFFSKNLIKRHLLVDVSLNYGMDYELWLYLSCNNCIAKCEKALATYRLHDKSKTVGTTGYEKFHNEWHMTRVFYKDKLALVRKGYLFISHILFIVMKGPTYLKKKIWAASKH